MKKKKTGQQRSTGPSDVQIGLRLRVMRIDKKLSQSGLGELLGVTFQQVQKYERGVNRLSLSRSIEIANILDTSLDQLAGVDGRLKGDATFDLQRYKLAQSFEGLDGDVAAAMRRLVDLIKNGNGKKR